MRKHKTILVIFLCVLAISIVTILIIPFSLIPSQLAILVNCPTEILHSGFHPGNNRQHTSSTWLGCYNGRLYYFGGEKSNLNQQRSSLFVFKEGTLEEVAPLSRGNSNITILGIVDSFIYYRLNNGKDYTKQKLYCYDLQSNEDKLIFCGDLNLDSSLYFADDGSVFFPLMPVYGEKTQFIHVSGQNMCGIKMLHEGYPLGDSVYYVVSEYSDVQVERIVKTDLDGKITLDEIPFAQSYGRSVIPYENGLLVHNEGLNSLLYRIDKDGNVTELLNVPCLSSESAVNIHKSDAYISLLRYEEYGEKGMLRYKNDSLKGTYRINLIDGTVKKVNDLFFDGIYNFDDICFYCSDEHGNIYRMDFDGTVSPILLLSEQE